MVAADAGEGLLRICNNIPRTHLPYENMPAAITNGILPVRERAPKLDIPLKEKNHPQAHFEEEKEGWHGYIEWEKYPEKKKLGADILSQYDFAEV